MVFESWGSLLSAPDGFVGLLDDATAARTWLSTHGARLTEIEVGASSLNWTESLTHQDLRSDNIVYSRQLGPLFVDWPYLTVGPRLMDIAFAAPSIEAEGGPTCAQTVELYQKISKVRFSVEEIRTAAVIVSGFFATRAFLDPIPGLPRVRWIQKRQLFPALRWMNQVLDVPGTY